MAEGRAMTTGFAQSERAELYYECRGHGPPLLMISGAGGAAGDYAQVADRLADQFKVITYDRRGCSRSTRLDGDNFELSQQSRDALAVLTAATGGASALVFGSSGGGCIGLDLCKSHPSAVRGVVCHEPPTIRLLPDGDEWRSAFAEIYLEAIADPAAAAAKFRASIGGRGNALASERFADNFRFFMRNEMLGFSNYHPDLERIAENRVALVMAAGNLSLDLYYGRTAKIIADRLGCGFREFPGGHLAYVTMPGEFAEALREALACF